MSQGARVAITGVPRSGKSMLSRGMRGPEARSTDDLAGRGWSQSSEAASKWFDEPGPLLVEGVAVPRALRKWLARNPEGRPVDQVIFLSEPHEKLSDGQERMGKGVRTVMEEILPELEKRGVGIRWR